MSHKIVFFSTGMSAGGAERVIATLANAMDARGFDVVIAVIKGTESAYDLAPGINFRSAELDAGAKNLPRAILFYQRVIKDEAPDVVASFSTKSDIIALLAVLLFRLAGRLVVSDRADPNSRNARMQRVCNLLYRRADAIVCQSEAVANYYRARCPEVEISVIRNPLNEASIGSPQDTPRKAEVIAVGRLTPQKNHVLAIRTFQALHERFPELRMKIFGTGPEEGALHALIRNEQLQGAVELAGISSNIMREHENAALFLFTSDYEGYPNALLEAAATGIPTVTTNFSPGTAREIIRDGINGYVVPRDDRRSLVEASIKALSGHLSPAAIAVEVQQVRESHHIDRILVSWLSTFRLDRPGA